MIDKWISIGVKIIVNIKPSKEPIVASLIAEWPSPFSRNLWAGRTDNAVSSFGAPKYVEGRVSRNVCVIAIEMIIIARVIGFVRVNIKGEIEMSNAEIRFT